MMNIVTNIIQKIKAVKICDLIQLLGVVMFAIFGAANLIIYAVLGAATPFIVLTVISMLFVLAAVFAYKSRVSLVWVLIAAANIVLCGFTNLPEFMTSPLFVVQAIAACLIAAGSAVMQKIENQPHLKIDAILLACIVFISAFSGIFWAASVGAVNGKTASSRNEIWGVPDKYGSVECKNAGTVEEFEYTTKAYAADSRVVSKKAQVYLPYGYSEDKEYNILYLMHGTFDDESYWLIKNPNNKVMLDNMIYHGDIQPLIVVTPTWYTENDCAGDTDKLTYAFKHELRNELMQAVESKYSTYASDTTAEAFIESRDHRAFAGLSRGAATTYRAAFNGCLDYFSWFGAFAGCMTSEEEFNAGSRSDEFKDYKINYLYNTNGSFDILLKEHYQSYKLLLDNEPRLVSGKNCSFDIFPMNFHSDRSWHIALYNCLQKFFI